MNLLDLGETDGKFRTSRVTCNYKLSDLYEVKGEGETLPVCRGLDRCTRGRGEEGRSRLGGQRKEMDEDRKGGLLGGG